MNFREAAEEFYADKEGTCTIKTLMIYRNNLEHFVKWAESKKLGIDQIKKPHVRDYLSHLRGIVSTRGGPYSDHNVQSHMRILRTFLNWLGREEDFSDLLVNKSVGRNVPVPQIMETEIVIFTPQDIKALYRAVDDEDSAFLRARGKVVLSLLLDTGIRDSELAFDPVRKTKTRVEPTGLICVNMHLDPEDSYIKVFGKGRKEREVPIGKATRRAIQAYLRLRAQRPRTSDPFLLVNASGDALTKHGVECYLDRLQERTGIHVHAHKFRHTFAVNYLMAGGDLYTLSRLLGHTTIKMTEKYLRAMTQKQARSAGISVADNMTM